jgi:hypothetical protein
MSFKISEAERIKIAAVLPRGYDVAELRSVPLQVQLIDEEVVHTAGELIGKNGRPFILRTAAWMAHADVPNANGDMFRGEDLQALSPTLFREPNFGVMDWNHAAILNSLRGTYEDPEIIGVWYKAEYSHDLKAGRDGVLVHGMVFAWLFPEQADAMAAEQLRNGYVAFSMAAIPSSVEVLPGGVSVLNDPIFFTVSALDKAPADKDAVGVVSADPDVSASALWQQLSLASSNAGIPIGVATTSTGTINGTTWIAATDFLPKESQVMDEAINEQIAELKAELEALRAERAVELSAEVEYARQISEAGEQHAAEVAARDTTIAEMTSAREAMAAEVETLSAQVEQLTADLAVATAALAQHAADAAAHAAEEQLKERLASLPTVFLEAHARRSEDARAAQETKWKDMSDEDWETYRTEELLFGFPTKVGYTLRTEQEGRLVPTAEGVSERITRHLK